jgi:hypothetical protein
MTQTRYLSAALFFMIQKMHGPLMMLQLWRPAFNRVISAKKHFKNTYPLLHLLLDISLSLALYNQIMTVLPKILTLCLAPFGIWQTPLLGAILFGCNTALAITALFYVLPVVVTSLSTLSNFVFRQPAVANSFSVPASSYNYSKNIVSMSTLAKKDMAQEIVGSILHQREAQEPVVLRSLARLFDITEVLSSLRLCFFPHNIALPLAQELNARGDIQRPSLAVIPINVMDDCLAELRAHNIIPKPCLLFTDPQGATRIIDFNTNEELNNHLRNN